MTIYKYEIPFQDESLLKLPRGAQILSFQNQDGKAVIWALVDPSTKKQDNRYFHMVGTGHPIEDTALTFIGTAQFRDGALVFHLFEKKP